MVSYLWLKFSVEFVTPDTHDPSSRSAFG